MPYLQINLAVDLVLIVILSLTLLPKHPKFIVGLFVLYLIPWIFPLQTTPIRQIPHSVPSVSVNPSSRQIPASNLTQNIQALNSGADPRTTLDKTQDLYQQVLQVLGTATGTAPSANTPDPQVLNAFTRHEVTTQPSRLGQAMEDLKMNVQAAWFYLRLFWLLAAFLLWIQNSYIGCLALIPNLVPLFYLARALPRAYEKIKAQPWMQEASVVVADEQAGQIVAARYSVFFAALLIALPTFFFLLLFWRQMRGVISRGLKRFLKPDLYQVRLNGHVMDFKKEGQDLVIEGLRFKANRMVQDRKKPQLWRLGSGTVIEFVPRK